MGVFKGITSTITVDGNNASISLIPNIPNFREYQMKELPSGDWQKNSEKLNVKFTKDKHELAFRAVNLAGWQDLSIELLLQRNRTIEWWNFLVCSLDDNILIHARL